MADYNFDITASFFSFKAEIVDPRKKITPDSGRSVLGQPPLGCTIDHIYRQGSLAIVTGTYLKDKRDDLKSNLQKLADWAEEQS